MDNRYLELYTQIYPIENAKSRDGIQYEGLCPLHDDTHNSFGFRIDDGRCNCFAGCLDKGGAYDYALKMGMAEIEARKYFINHNENWTPTTNPQSINPLPPPIECDKLKAKAKQYFKNLQNIKNPPKELVQRLDMWSDSVIKELLIGVDDDKALTIPYINHKGVVECIYHHNKKRTPYVEGDGRCRWYPMHKIFTYDRDKWMYGVEGGIDVITGLSNGLQTFTATTGALSIPMKVVDGKKVFDLDIIEHCNRGIRVIKDNDDSGRKGGEKLAKAIKEYYPSHKVHFSQYDLNLPKGYDLTDAYMDSPEGDNFWNAIDKGEQLHKKKKGFNVFMIDDFMVGEYPSTDPIIKNYLYKNHISIIGGDTGCQKSWVSMQVALSIASGVDLFEHFETTPSNVMLVQFENENTDMQNRFRTMLPYFEENAKVDNWKDNLFICPKDAEGSLFIDNWKIIDTTLEENNFNNGVIIVDNLYTSTNLEIQSNNEITSLLREIDRIKKKYSLTILLIAHTNKIDHTIKDLKIDQIQGGKTLTAQVGFVAMMGKSSTSNDIKVMKMVKCRSDENRDLEEIPFKLHWDNDNGIFRKGAIIKNIAIHFQPMNEKWEITLIKDVYRSMKVRTWFNRASFREHLSEDYKDMESTKETRLLTRLCKWGYLNKVEYDKYSFNKNEIEELD